MAAEAEGHQAAVHETPGHRLSSIPCRPLFHGRPGRELCHGKSQRGRRADLLHSWIGSAVVNLLSKKSRTVTTMTNFIPVFPLGIVVFPGETVNLHIFEPRYKQLVNECYAEGKPFGIPTVIDNKLNEMGTLVRVAEIVKVYDNG